MRNPVLLAVVLAALASPPAAFAAPTDAQAEIHAATSDEARLSRIFADARESADRLDPIGRLYQGEAVEPGELAMLFTDQLDRERLQSAKTALAEIATVKRGALGEKPGISYDVFAFSMRRQAAWLQPDMRGLVQARPFNHFGGFHVEFPGLMSSTGPLAFDNDNDYARALELDRTLPRVFDTAIARFRQGMTSGVTEPKRTVANMIAQIDALLAGGVEDSPFYSPAQSFPDAMPDDARKRWRKAYTRTVRDEINPAYQRLRAFLAEEYLPAARDQVGLSAMNGGDVLYRQLIERETTLALDPVEVHELGLREVARIRSEMVDVRAALGFTGTLPEFFEHIRSDPRYHPASAEELTAGFEAIRREVERQIPRFFSHTPRTRLVIEPYSALRERFEPGGSYQQGTADGSRPGVFYYNTYDLPSRFLTGMTTLYLHEAIPGHHFQISLAQEDESLPSFQRFDGNNAFVEGWALYAETLGYEMGLYDDPMPHWGTLDDEMLRAMRLVVDTGIHARGWTRDRAIGYMLANSGMGRTDAAAEVDRYIANPAQALSYKIGALTIQRLRRKAETALGERFDIRAFHDAVLDSGALPLPILEAKIDRWIAARR